MTPITIRTEKGTRTATPLRIDRGLAIIRFNELATGAPMDAWSITHLRSGKLLCFAPSLESANSAMDELLDAARRLMEESKQ